MAWRAQPAPRPAPVSHPAADRLPPRPALREPLACLESPRGGEPAGASIVGSDRRGGAAVGAGLSVPDPATPASPGARRHAPTQRWISPGGARQGRACPLALGELGPCTTLRDKPTSWWVHAAPAGARL